MSRTKDVHSKTAVQIKILWGDEPLQVTELNPPRDFSVGEVDADFVVPAAQLGAARMELLRVTEEGLVVTAAADADVSVKDERGTRHEPNARIDGDVLRVDLSEGHTVRVARGGFVFELSAGQPEASVGRGGDGEWRGSAGYFGASFASVGALLAAAAFLVPPSTLTSGEAISPEQLIAIQQYLDAAAEKERADEPKDSGEAKSAASSESGAQAREQEGQMGKLEAPKANARFQKRGPRDNPEPELARLQEARSFGMVGLLAGGVFEDPDAPTAPWGRDMALGNADLSAHGNLWGETIGEAGGANGLGLYGPGIGGGGPYLGVGLDSIGTIGGGNGSCTTPDCQGIGSDRGRVQGDHRTKQIKVRMAPPMISGRIPPEVIQRVVRQNFGVFRMCYEKGLMRNPNLSGRVTVRFLISSSGTVANASSEASSLPDSSVTSCVAGAFYGLSFPKPEAGSVRVSYPIVFSPG